MSESTISSEALIEALLGEAYKNNSDILSFFNNLVNPSLLSENEILKATSYTLYEFENVDVSYAEGSSYTKSISPLFSESVIKNSNNREILQVLFEDIPFYFLDCPYVIDDSTDINTILQISRDSSKTDVPSYLQTDFWSVWFNETWGFIQNSIILDIYNMLKYPMMNENQYLNMDIFAKLSDNIRSSSEDTNSFLDFMDTSEEYETYLESHENDINYVDRLNDIVDEKLSGIYSMLNYKPDYFEYLSNLSDSLLYSAQMDSLDVSKEKSIYKLQDIQNELLRRKFAGSSTLYNITLSSIGRQGGLNRTINIGKFKTSTTDDTVFRDKRKLKIINLPGIVTGIKDPKTVDYDPMYELTQEYGNTYGMPLDVVIPLYYTSSDQIHNNITHTYDASSFYDDSNKTTKENTRYFLRDISSTIEWNELGFVTQYSVPNYFSYALDEKILVTDTTSDSGYSYKARQLDSTVTYIDQNGETQVKPIALDIMFANYSTSNISGVMFDVNANKLMYHENSLQKQYKAGYPYLTYSIADGNSVSLMDISVLDYMKTTTEKKSRVQDRIDFGTQISYYIETNPYTEVEENFFAIEYHTYDDFKTDGTFSQKTTDIGEADFIVLYYVSVKYRAVEYTYNDGIYTEKSNDSNYDITSVESIPITRIYLNDPTTASSTYEEYKSYDLYRELSNGDFGIIPFTYPEYKGEDIVIGEKYNDGSYNIKNSIKLGLLKGSYYDDANDHNYTVANFLFGDSAAVNNINFGNISPLDLYKYNHDDTTVDTDEDYAHINNNTLNWTPAENSENGVIYYSIYRDGKYYWSEPIYYILMDNVPKIDESTGKYDKDKFYPDWYGLQVQYNAYMNTVKDSASPMRWLENNVSEYILCDNIEEDITVVGTWYSYDESSDSYTYIEPEYDQNKELIGPLAESGVVYYRKNPKYTVDWSSIHNIVENVRDGETVDLSLSSEESGEQRKNFFFYENRFTGFKLMEEDSTFDYYRSDIIYYNKSISADNITTYEAYTYNGYDGLVHNDDIILFSYVGDIYSYLKANYSSYEDKLFFNISETFEDYPTAYRIIKNSYSQISTENIENYCNKESFPESPSSNVIYYDYTNRKFYRYNESEQIYVEAEDVDYIDIFTLDPATLPETSKAEDGDKYYYCESYTETENGSTVTKFNSKMFEFNSIKVTSLEDYTYSVSEDASYKKCIYISRYTPIRTEFYDLLCPVDKYKLVATYRLSKYDYITDSYILGDYRTDIFDNLSNFIEEININENDVYIYDMRFYEKSVFEGIVSIYNPLLMNGSLREQFSYSSSIMKLAYTIYKDSGIFRTVSTLRGLNDTSSTIIPNKVSYIRFFNRSIWDSILVDRYPYDEYGEGYSKTNNIVYYYDKDIYYKTGNTLDEDDCINQTLVTGVETSCGVSLFDKDTKVVKLVYNGTDNEIGPESSLSIVNTTLYPIIYKDEVFASDDSIPAVYGKNEAEAFRIKLPVDAAKGSFKYFGDLNINIVVSTEVDMSNPLSHGDNIESLYDSDNKVGVSVLKDYSVKSDPDKNYVLLPLRLPKVSSRTSTTYLDKFKIRNFKIASSFSKMLDSGAYYNEQIIPIAAEDENRNKSYIFKYNAIRLYKEGTYYVTVKYPMMILPMFDYDYFNVNYPIFYGSIRFKIEVSGEPIENTMTYDSDYISKNFNYNKSNIVYKLSSTESLYYAEDNRTYPHRRINIRLYSMTNSNVAGLMDNNNETYSFSWNLIGSNIEDECTGNIVYLDSETVKKGLFIKDYVDVYMSKNYTMPFFLAKQIKTTENESNYISYDATSADDDLIDPISILNISTTNRNSENISISNIDELDELRLYSLKDYSLLFDYTSNITEISYTNNLYDGDLDAESENYSRLVNVLDRVNRSEYLYDTHSSYSYSGRMSGYQYKNGSWLSSSSEDSDINYGFGDPYSKLSSKNTRIDDSSRDIVNNSYTFPYIIENYDNSNIGIASMYSNNINRTIPLYQAFNNSFEICYSNEKFNELLSLNRIYSSLLSTFDIHQNNVFISELSKIQPNVVQQDEVVYNTKDFKPIDSNNVSNSAFDMYAYQRDHLNVLSIYDANDFTITRNGLYDNNLIQGSYYSDNTIWGGTLLNGSWTPDTDYGRDVYEINISKYYVTTDYIVGTTIVDDLYVKTTEFSYNTVSKLTNTSGNIAESDVTYYVFNDENNTYDITTEYIVGTTNVDNFYVKINDGLFVPVIYTTRKSGNIAESGVTYYAFNFKEGTYDVTANYTVGTTNVDNFFIKIDESLYLPVEYSTATTGNIAEKDITYYVLNDEGNTITYVKGKNYYNGTYEVAINVECDSSEIAVYAQMLSDSTEIGEPIELSEIVTSGNWNNYSAEVTVEEDSYANGIKFIITTSANNSTIKLGKAIVRLSVTNRSHVLGLSNTKMSSIVTNKKFSLPACYLLLYKAKISEEFINIQMKPTINSGIIWPVEISTFIDSHNINPNSDSSKLKKLLEPWTRKITYIERDNNDNEDVLKEEEYHIRYDSFGKKIIDTTSLCNKLYSGMSASFDDTRTYLMLRIPYSENSILRLKNELENTFDATLNEDLPVSLENESFSALTNCFSPELILNNDDSSVAVTNIQFVGINKDSRGAITNHTLYELEYLPIIYNERYYHFSLNFMMNEIHEDGSTETTGE